MHSDPNQGERTSMHRALAHLAYSSTSASCFGVLKISCSAMMCGWTIALSTEHSDAISASSAAAAARWAACAASADVAPADGDAY